MYDAHVEKARSESYDEWAAGILVADAECIECVTGACSYGSEDAAGSAGYGSVGGVYEVGVAGVMCDVGNDVLGAWMLLGCVKICEGWDDAVVVCARYGVCKYSCSRGAADEV